MLADLGSKITSALTKLSTTTVIDEAVLDSVLKDIKNALFHADVNMMLVAKMSKNVKKAVNIKELASGINKRKVIKKAVFDELKKMLESERPPFEPKKGQPNVIMFVGLQGSGKTTTIAKYARWYQRKGWKPCMVCADTFRAGAYEQLKQNAVRIRVPFFGDPYEADPVAVAKEGVELFKRDKFDIIIVDTSGRHKQESALFDEMQSVRDAVKPDNIVFVLDSTIGAAAIDQAKAFRETVDVGSVIITKLDGHAKGGGALSAVAATQSPIIFLGTGEHFEDFDKFEARSFVRRLLGMGDVQGLVEELKGTGMLDNQPEMMKRLQKGIFTLRDMYAQFQAVMKLGPLNRVMSMIPGLPQGLIPKGGEQEGQNRIRKMMYMMDSMTDDELDGHVELDPHSTRARRIAQGSGTTWMEVSQLLKYQKQMAKMVGKMGKNMPNMMTNDNAFSKQMARNPNAVMQQLQKTMDPAMLRQMGGMGNMMKMMKEMGKNGEMQKMMSKMMGR